MVTLQDFKSFAIKVFLFPDSYHRAMEHDRAINLCLCSSLETLNLQLSCLSKDIASLFSAIPELCNQFFLIKYT